MIKTALIENLDFFSQIWEVNLNKQPNQEFTTTINQNIYKIEVKTLIDDKSQIAFYKNDILLGGGFVKSGIDYLFLNTNDDGAFFFLKNTDSDLIEFNFSDFGDNIKLYYGIYDKNINIADELETFYNLRSNTQDLAVF